MDLNSFYELALELTPETVGQLKGIEPPAGGWEGPDGVMWAEVLVHNPFLDQLLDGLKDVGFGLSPLLLVGAEVVKPDVLAGLIERGADPNFAVPGAKKAHAATPLTRANTEAAVRLLLSHGADPEKGRDFGRKAIHAAAQREDVGPLRALDQHGCSLEDDGADFSGATTPLMAACFQPSAFACARYLIARGVALDTKSKKNGKTALHFAIEHGAFHTARMLVEKGAAIDIASKTGQTPLHAAIAKGKKGVGMAAWLLSRPGAPIDVQDQAGLTPLMLALTKKDAKLARHLVALGADTKLGLKKAKKVGKAKLPAGATAADIAAAVGLGDRALESERQSFEKEIAAAFRGMPSFELPATDDPARSAELGTARWAQRFRDTFGTLPEGLTCDEALARRLQRRVTQSYGLDERLVAAVAEATGHRLSEELLAFHRETGGKYVISWRAADGSHAHANFRLLTLRETFVGGNDGYRVGHSVHAELGLPRDVMPELETYYPLAAEEFGMTMLSLEGGRERVFFYESYGDKAIQALRVDFPGYLEALLRCRGVYGWQAYFFESPKRDPELELLLAEHFGEDERDAFLALAES